MEIGRSLNDFCHSVFWNVDTSWNTTNPDFTPCFEITVLTWIPCAFLWIFLPLEIYYLRHSQSFRIPFNLYNSIKLALIGSMSLFALIDTVYYSFIKWIFIPAFVTSSLIKFFTFILFMFLTRENMKYGIRSSGILFLFSFLLVLCGAPKYRTDIMNSRNIDFLPLLNYILYYPIAVAVLFLNCFSDARPETTKYPIPKDVCPENHSSFLSKLLFAWFDKLAWKGYRKPLVNDDLWSLDYDNTSAAIVGKFENSWLRTLEKIKRTPNVQIRINQANGELLGNRGGNSDRIEYRPAKSNKVASIVTPLYRTFGVTFFFGCLLKVAQDLLTFVSPQILSLLIDFVKGDDPMWRGYFYASLLLVINVIQTLLLSQYFHRMFKIGIRIRTALIAVIYKKSLTISSGARRDFTLGEIVNLMSVDAQRFTDLMAYINMVWSAPLQITLALFFLWQYLGPSVLAGLAVMIIMIPLNGWIASKIKTYQIKQMKYKDDRVKLMNEILSGIKVLKLYAWEPSFEKQVLHIRNKEVKVLMAQAYLNAATSFIWACSPFLVSLVTFGVYVLSSDENILDAKTAFVSLSLFNILRFPLTMLPMMISNIVQTSVSVKRINKFLNSEDLDPNAVSHEKKSVPLSIEKGDFSWQAVDGYPILRNINVEINSGSLVAVVGPVGSGKSSLISAFLGEMYKLSGSVNTNGTIAYVPQQAWIQNATFRDNITFGDQVKDSFYDNVLSACALKPDLEILPAGDMTEIGEKGINLSGGQKQRISLARAVYFGSDIYLLDDPLSAVDSHVGKHIFEHVIGPKGLLKHKTRILVTHSVTFLSQCDLIIVLKDGSVSESGTFKELSAKKGDFADFLLTYLKESAVEPDEEDVDKLKEILGEENVTEKIVRQRSKNSESDSVHSFSRQRSTSETEDSRKMKKPPGTIIGQKLIETERAETGTVKWQVFAYYLSSIGAFLSISTIVMNLMFQGFSVGSNMWLSKWSSDNSTVVNGTQVTSKRDLYLGVYAALGLGQAIALSLTTLLNRIGCLRSSKYLHYHVLHNIVRVPLEVLNITPVGRILSRFSKDIDVVDNVLPDKLNHIIFFIIEVRVGVCIADLSIRIGCWKSAKYLHNRVLRTIMRVPLTFMDITPIGRILSRFSKDTDVVDNTLPFELSDLIYCLGDVISTLFIISYSTPIFIIVIVPIGIVYFFVQRFYVATSRQLKRLESISRSPIYSHFGETVSGAQSIRAYGLKNKFIIQSEEKVDFNQKSYYPNLVSNRWLSVRLETVGNLIIFFAALFSVLQRGKLSAGIVGLSVSYALQITQTLNWLVRMTSEVETNIVAVERIKEYGETPQEAAWEIEDRKVPDNWPDKGEIKFNDFRVRYREGLELVLKGLTFTVNGGEKVGIVGRTGAGKSSLTLSLFRIIESAGGSISIDGIDISTLGLHSLRSRITIIPQDPVLFSGTLRINLDPIGLYSDESIWRALELAHLKTFITSLNAGLQYEVTEGGDNFSVGQRQLICLARALLRKTKVLILDEATAAIDLETDDLIQTTIRNEFKSCTVLTIAHRLNTIMDYDKIIVLDKGVMVEYDTPSALLKSKNSVFYGMAADAGLL
ncbi:hypothetical protein V9T40_008913 [Parthenolecanium corni]|uniref:ABC-type glutathione-S-conjugate transporter n=1 Tax=Parthenolecanium corni TaxID=536013 RepID=A0AAN9Y8A9_9HEMI